MALMVSGGAELKTPAGKVASVWTYFGYKVDTTTGKVKTGGGMKPTCKLCKTEMTNCTHWPQVFNNKFHYNLS